MQVSQEREVESYESGGEPVIHADDDDTLERRGHQGAGIETGFEGRIHVRILRRWGSILGNENGLSKCGNLK